jgi:hypothetical protein
MVGLTRSPDHSFQHCLDLDDLRLEDGGMTSGILRLFWVAMLWALLIPGTARASALTPELVAAMRMPPERFTTLSCRRLWYLEHEVLAAGRVCPKSERARRTFVSAPKCISSMERILPSSVRRYLDSVRATARAKSCAQ